MRKFLTMIVLFAVATLAINAQRTRVGTNGGDVTCSLNQHTTFSVSWVNGIPIPHVSSYYMEECTDGSSRYIADPSCDWFWGTPQYCQT